MHNWISLTFSDLIFLIILCVAPQGCKLNQMKLELTANGILANQSEFGYNGIRLPKADIINSPAHYALTML